MTKVSDKALLAVLGPLDYWTHKCHEASLELVRSNVLGEECRVARGSCRGVTSQHSWVIVGGDCYDETALIVDPTLWSYDSTVKGIWRGNYKSGRHTPHGKGLIWDWGRPPYPTGPIVDLTPLRPFSGEATLFLGLLGPLDREGWITLTKAPVEGWPSGEIIAALDDTEGLAAHIPIDILGMVTDRNPSGLYLG